MRKILLLGAACALLTGGPALADSSVTSNSFSEGAGGSIVSAQSIPGQFASAFYQGSFDAYNSSGASRYYDGYTDSANTYSDTLFTHYNDLFVSGRASVSAINGGDADGSANAYHFKPFDFPLPPPPPPPPPPMF